MSEDKGLALGHKVTDLDDVMKGISEIKELILVKATLDRIEHKVDLIQTKLDSIVLGNLTPEQQKQLDLLLQKINSNDAQIEALSK